MFIKKLSIVFSIILILFTININTIYAFNTVTPPQISNEYIKELEIIDNYMYLFSPYASGYSPISIAPSTFLLNGRENWLHKFLDCWRSSAVFHFPFHLFFFLSIECAA